MAACSSYYRWTPLFGFSPRQLDSSCSRNLQGVTYKINALFWRPKRSAEPQVLNPSLGTCTLIGSGPEGVSSNERIPQKISLSVVSSISDIPSEDWDACAVDASRPEKFDPFISHAFLMSLEESGSAVKETGWLPQHVVAQDEYKNTIGVVPLYLKSHSNGEFVFDYSWADAYYRYGHQYYPKLQSCVPFTPVTGPRILVRNTWCKDQVFDMLVLALKDLTAKLQVSSLHVTFPSETEWHKMKSNGFLQRIGMQYHWKNRNYKNPNTYPDNEPYNTPVDDAYNYPVVDAYNYPTGDAYNYPVDDAYNMPYSPVNPHNVDYGAIGASKDNSFDEFLMDMKQSKRKNIRQERKKISAQNLKMKRLRGDEIKATHWDSFFKFYRNTTDNKWGRAYLTRDFFHILGSKMGDRVLLVVAEEGDELVAGALNLIGGDTLFGRLWGCLPRAYYPSLHFEACYYQAIEAAIELNLNKVEAGAQGEHKIQRGYVPVTTYSCHYLLDDGFRKAIGDFLVHETDQVKHVIKLLRDSGPFKDGIDLDA